MRPKSFELSKSLIDADDMYSNARRSGSASKIFKAFLSMCVCFAINASVVTTVIAFVGADFPQIGVDSVGVLYVSYAFSAMFLGPLMQALLGVKGCLVVGMSQYCCYLLVYLIAEQIGPGRLADNIVLVGSAIGGIGSGYLWPAQGAFFAAAASKYAHLTGQRPEAVAGVFASYFATCFLFCEISFKFIGAGIKLAAPQRPNIMYLVFFCVGVISTLGMLTVESMEKGEQKRPKITLRLVTNRVSAALLLLGRDKKMALMLPFEITAGFAVAFLNGFISPRITKPVLHSR